MINLENLKLLVDTKDVDQILLLFDDYNVVSITEIVKQLENSEILYLMEVLPKNIGGDLFANLEELHQEEIFDEVEEAKINDLVSNLYIDDVVVMLQGFSNSLRRKILNNIDEKLKEDITTVYNYSPDTAGAIMTLEFIELKARDTYKTALDKVKLEGSVAEVVTDCYIVNQKRVLQGKIKLKDLLFGKDEDVVYDAMETHVIFASVNDTQESVLALMQKYDLHVIPVVNDLNALVGIITIDDILDVMEKEVTKDVHLMAGVSSLEQSYVNTSIIEMVKAQLPWLLIVVAAAILSESIIFRFSRELIMLPAIAAFIPMIMGTAGNAASQSSVMVIRAIVVDELSVKDAFKVFIKEISISFYLSIAIIFVLLIRLYILPPSVGFDLIIAIVLATILSIFIANVVGGLLPILALKTDADPTAMAIPLVTNIMGIISLLVYFIIIVLILKL